MINSLNLLKKLIAFDTTSAHSNLELINYVKALLEEYGIEVQLNLSLNGDKANLFASVGDVNKSGILLSGHTDVVPAYAKNWHSNPFIATERDGKLYGRGTSDMKGFVACAINALCQASQLARDGRLTTPLHLCLSYDEEVGCLGVRHLLAVLPEYIKTPRLCLIGEPTLMQIAVGHKGKAVYQAVCRGESAHSSLAPNYVNAIHVASEVVTSLVKSQDKLATTGAKDVAYEVPYSTIHVGKIAGGQAINVVADSCVVDYEIRYLAEESAETIQSIIQSHIDCQPHHEFVEITQVNAYPGLDTDKSDAQLAFLHSLLADNDISEQTENTQAENIKNENRHKHEQIEVSKLAFGTEGGLFSQAFDSPVFVCGPGSIKVAHKPNEYIELAQLQQCDQFLSRLLNAITT